jgi:Sulfotransferase family
MANYQREWKPPPRPEWVRRINEEGECMNIRGVVPLDEHSLLESARRSTGLSDFGDEDWREPFRVLIHSMDADADLNLMGRIRTRSEILQLLEARLQIEATYKRHPEIEEEEIVQPIIVVGQGRSGTSFLVNVLAANPENASLMQWVAMFPCPPPEAASYRTDPRIEKADRLIKQWIRVTPTLESMHEFAGNVPMEDCHIHALSFRATDWFGMLGQASTYEAYMARQDPAPMLRYHKRVLKLLQWKNPCKHWALKNVTYLDRLDALLKIYPDACFVWPHRDPIRAQASTISLIGTLQWGRSDHPFKGGTFEYVTNPDLAAARLNAVIDQLESGVVPPRQFYNLLYRDLVADPLSVIADMYQHFGIELTENARHAMRQYLAENPRSARPAHRFDIGSPEVVLGTRQAYERYQNHFHIPSE